MPVSRSSPDSGLDQNERVRLDLTARVRELVEGKAGTLSLLAVHDWAILDYSSCFSIEWKRQQSHWGVFVKIPKTDIDRQTVLPTSEADRLLAREEFASLTYLGRQWNGSDARVDYVKPLAFFEDWNAIVTERAYAGELLGPFRRAVVWRWLSHNAGSELTDILRRIGMGLRIFHRRSQAAEMFAVEPFEGRNVVQKVQRIVGDLRAVGVSQPLAPASFAALRAWMTWRRDSQPAMTLKGLDVRNVLVNDEGRVWLLDPGRLKRDAPEADLARLLVTCQLMYWGTPWFSLRAQPGAQYEHAMLDGYDDGRLDRAALRLLVVKELFKHWRQAYVALTRKRWPRSVAWTLARTYIDGFYRAETVSAIARLGTALPNAAAHPI